MTKMWVRCTGGALLLGMAACQTTSVEKAPVSQTLAPMDYREYVVGEIIQWQESDGDIKESRVVEISDGKVSFSDSDGCSWTQFSGGFSPPTEFSNCDGNSGTQQVMREGNIFPLAVGATETWSYSGTNNRGDSWSGKRTCSVTEAVQVTVPAGTFDTYHVVCEDDSRVRDWYVAAETQRPVLYTRKHKRRAEAERLELVALKSPMS